MIAAEATLLMTLDQHLFHHVFDNGLTLVAESMPWLESAAFSISVPGGFRYDPPEFPGAANFVSEMVQRGAGDRDSREFLESLERLGVDFGSSVSVYHSSFNGAMQSGQLHDALQIFSDVLLMPHFPDDQLEDGRQVCLQEILSLDDDLAQRTLMALRRRFYGEPDGMHCEGTVESVSSIGIDELKSLYQATFRPNGTIIAVAGRIEWDRLKAQVGELLGEWSPVEDQEIVVRPPLRGVAHLQHDSEQTHIALAYPGRAYSDDEYFLSRGAVGVLSGGMSSRLFTEIREKRGLCYSVFATAHSLKDRGAITCYSGTSSDRAQETLDVLIEQLEKLPEGVHEDELRRLKVQIRSSLVMQQESCRSRARSIAGDWFHLGRVRTLGEITELVNDLSVESINGYLQRNPPGDFCVVTLGAHPLQVADQIG